MLYKKKKKKRQRESDSNHQTFSLVIQFQCDRSFTSRVIFYNNLILNIENETTNRNDRVENEIDHVFSYY